MNDHYEAIALEFGFDTRADREAAQLLRDLLAPRDTFRHVGTELKNRASATVVGCGPALASLTPGDLPEGPVVAADGATERLHELDIIPRVVVTDLDGDPRALRWAAGEGASMVIHAHGDNMDALRDRAPELGPLRCGTYQAPLDTPGSAHSPLWNLGGFTDGDRAVLLCERMRVRNVNLVAFDFEAPPSQYSHRWDPATKPAKLAWAKRIIEDVAGRGTTAVRHWLP